ncbi:HAMP domain-containing histidine kinase [Aerophototrophica crusticola]|uniref:histidine kinase n=1 Tax=Aerophototrophica crusticola TaxID=1709002 RepID=A0A858R878_9PROT|nr:HAMP domain-containing histidine kinase [Rhodospirillaceae bacterium B3]
MALTLPPFARSLSSKLLLLTVAFVMLAEVLIFLPSAAKFRVDWLNARLASAHLAALSVVAAPEGMVTDELEAELLSHVQAYAVDVTLADKRVLMLMRPDQPAPMARYDLAASGPLDMIRETLALLLRVGNRVVTVTGPSPKDPAVGVAMLVQEGPLRAALLEFSGRILWLSIIISLVTASLVFLSLHVLTVRPMRRLVEAMMAFKRDPESAEPAARLATRRQDEVGIAHRELLSMQAAVRQALRQRERLATVGTAVTKINHDIRGILSSATLLSERLLDSPDPQVRRDGPRILAALERAAQLCGQTLDYTRDGVAPPRREPVALARLAEEVGEALLVEHSQLPQAAAPVWQVDIPEELVLEADRGQLFRALGNLGRNALEAGATRVTVAAVGEDGHVRLSVGDDGTGLPTKVLDRLFQPFASSGKPNGTGLGLAIAREVARAHGGDIRLDGTGPGGTRFTMVLRG